MVTLKIDGACHCGAITYEADVDPGRAIICHCLDCQTMSGAPYRVNVRAAARSVRMQGEPTRYVKIGGSGDPVLTTFCPKCGTPLYSAKGDTPEFLSLRTGAIRQRDQLRPMAQGFCESGQAWAMDLSGLPVVQTARP